MHDLRNEAVGFRDGDAQLIDERALRCSPALARLWIELAQHQLLAALAALEQLRLGSSPIPLLRQRTLVLGSESLLKPLRSALTRDHQNSDNHPHHWALLPPNSFPSASEKGRCKGPPVLFVPD